MHESRPRPSRTEAQVRGLLASAEPQAPQRYERKHVQASPRRRGTRCGRRRAMHVASNVVSQVSQRLRQPLSLNPTNFERHYETRLALPYPVLTDLTPAQIALFEEQSTSPMGVDLEIQSTRFYPYGTTAAHVSRPSAARRQFQGGRGGFLLISAAGLPRHRRNRVSASTRNCAARPAPNRCS